MTASSAPPASGPPRRSAALGVVTTLLGSVVVLIGLALLAAGGGLMWLNYAERDASGYFSTSTTALSSTGHAFVSIVDFGDGTGPMGWLPERAIGSVRVQAELADGASVFIGIAPLVAIERYLSGVGYDKMSSLAFASLRAADRHLTGDPAALPQASTFWVASAVGLGRQSLAWDVRPGHWAVVIMRGDAAAPVVASVSLGAKAGWVAPLGGGLLAGGALLLLAGPLLAFKGARPQKAIVEDDADAG